jgi:quercetin dioxygenase-like cupin family protein
MIQVQRTDLAAMAGRVDAIIHLSSADDLRWAGLHVMAPMNTFALAAGARHDIYVIGGSLLERGTGHGAGTFLSRNHALTLAAGPAGAMFFMYRDQLARTSGQETLAGHGLVWSAGGVRGMRVARLSRTHHRVALVSWQPGTRVGAHTHPLGEEIFVLHGELRDERGVYPAGSWLRFHPGTGHAPYAEQDTLILLRNGHLSNSAVVSTDPSRRVDGQGH